MNVHKDSPLGRVTAAAAALEAQCDHAAQLVEQRKAELAKADQDLQVVPVDVQDLREVIKVQERQSALRYLLGLARGEAQRRARELDRTTERTADLQQRLARLEAGVKSLEDNTRVLPWSPVERAEKLLADRYRLAVLAGDPDELPRLMEEMKAGVDETRWADLRLELEAYIRDVASLCTVTEWYEVRVKADNLLSAVTVGGHTFTKHGAYLREGEVTDEIRQAAALEVEAVPEPQG